jgi:predicted nucleotidyltransferase
MTDTSLPIPLPYLTDFSALYRKAEAISHAYRSGNLVFFLGAGASKTFHWKFPNWPELLNELQAETPTQQPDDRNEIATLIRDGKYLLAAEAIKQYAIIDRDDRDEVVDRKVSAILARRPLKEGNSVLHQAILDFMVPIVTTNYDTILESTLRINDLDQSIPVFTFNDGDSIGACLDPTAPQGPFVFKLHGSMGKGSLILDEGDYANLYFHENWPRALALLRHILSTKMVVFVGFSLSDPEIMPILREATRYSSSYQHIAFLKKDNISRIEQDVLRSYYRVEPITYNDHGELPLLLLEMRNFNPRDRLTLKLLAKKDQVLEGVSKIVEKEKINDDCAIVLFGSYMKYGELTADSSDLDILLIDPNATDSRRAEFTEDISILGRRVDVTIMSRVSFEELLRQGDAFASSILVTGCPIRDPKGIFTILARGLVPEYQTAEVTANAGLRARIRWLRMCTLIEPAAENEFMRACLQWIVSFMQFSLIQRKPPASLLEASLLGNARFVIREFVQRFNSGEEAFFVDILRSSKGMAVSRPEAMPSIREVIAKLLLSLGANASKEETALLTTAGRLPGLDNDRVLNLYCKIGDSLAAVYEDRPNDSLPGKVEQELYTLIQDSYIAKDLNPFDWLFFFELYAQVGNLPKGDPGLQDALEKFKATFHS